MNGSGYLGGLPHAARFDYSYDGTMRSLEQSALRLGVDRLDIVLIHDVDVWTHGADAIENRFPRRWTAPIARWQTCAMPALIRPSASGQRGRDMRTLRTRRGFRHHAARRALFAARTAGAG